MAEKENKLNVSSAALDARCRCPSCAPRVRCVLQVCPRERRGRAARRIEPRLPVGPTWVVPWLESARYKTENSQELRHLGTTWCHEQGVFVVIYYTASSTQ